MEEERGKMGEESMAFSRKEISQRERRQSANGCEYSWKNGWNSPLRGIRVPKWLACQAFLRKP
jgi:hypothetical protein